MRIPLLTSLCLICSCFSEAQTTVRGNLLSKFGIPISAYNMVLEGTNIGTQTGVCGEFELKIPEGFNGDIIIGAITPTEWRLKSGRLKVKTSNTIILRSQSDQTNRICKTKIKKRNQIKI